MDKVFNRFGPGSVTAVVAVGISLMSAFFAWKQVDTAQSHNRLSVEPILHVTPYAEGASGRNGLYLSNRGLGPALLTSFEVEAAGVAANGFDNDRWFEVLRAAGVNVDCFATGWPRQRTAIKAGDEEALFFVKKNEAFPACHLHMLKLMAGDGIKVKVGYQSIYKEEKVEQSSTKVVSSRLTGV